MSGSRATGNWNQHVIEDEVQTFIDLIKKNINNKGEGMQG